MSLAHNFDPGLQQTTLEPTQQSWQLDGQSRDLSDAAADMQQEIPESMMSRLSILFGADIDPQDATRIMHEERHKFDKNEHDAHNFDLFIKGYPLNEIYLIGKGEVVNSMQRIYAHFASVVVDMKLETGSQDSAQGLEDYHARTVSSRTLTGLGKRAARFTVNIYGNEVNQLRITEEDAELVANITLDTYAQNIKALPDDKRNEYQQYITLMIEGLTDQQIAAETGVRPARVSGFFNQFKSRLVTSGFDQAFALTTLQRRIVEYRNPGLNVDNILAPPVRSKTVSEIAKRACDVEQVPSRYYTDADLSDLDNIPFVVMKPEEKIAMPTDYLVVDNSDEYPDDWQERGLCAQTDPEVFFPEKGGSTREAKKVCQSCEIRDKCLEYAMNNDERYGIWGGLSERERRKLKKDREAAAAS